jgi:hypothetical protein
MLTGAAPAFADPARHRKLFLPESRLKQHRMRTADLPGIRKASDKASDNDPRQQQTEHDVLRHQYPSDPQ